MEEVALRETPRLLGGGEDIIKIINLIVKLAGWLTVAKTFV